MSANIFKNCEIGLSQSSFCVHADSEATAFSLLKTRLHQLAGQAAKLSRCEALIFYPGCKSPLQIPVAMSTSDEPLYIEEISTPPNSNLIGADYLNILEFLQEQREEGNIVVVTSNVTRDDHGNPISTDSPAAGRDLCHHTSDLLKPSRAVWSSSQFSGYNYRLSWRRGFDDYEGLNPQYKILKDLLEKDGVVPNYEYTLYRPGGDKCSYSTSYYLCNDYCGDRVRVGVSRVQDWSIIEPAPELAAVR